jgi:hypothetical protein
LLGPDLRGFELVRIRQQGSPRADCTVGVTQCPILPGETFTCRFVVDRVSVHANSYTILV